MSKQLILRTVVLHPEVEAFVKQHFEIITEDQLNDVKASEIEVVLTNGEGFTTKSLMDKLPNLKLVDNFGAGYNGVDTEECKRRGIVLCNTPDVLSDDVADLAVGLLLSVSRQIALADRFVREGKWKAGELFPFGTKVSGKKAGIVGLGRIGSAIASRLTAFGMQIGYFGCNQPNLDYCQYQDLKAMALDSDFLIVSTSYNQKSHHLISKEVLQALGAKGILVNVSRGGLVDEMALCSLLDSEMIKGAALDVFEHEPHVPQLLIERSNTVLTPHIGSATADTRHKMAALVIANLQAFMEQGEYITPVKL